MPWNSICLFIAVSGNRPPEHIAREVQRRTRANTAAAEGQLHVEDRTATERQLRQERSYYAMGICVSCDAAPDGAATARVVLPSGELREYSPPATAGMALEEVGQQMGWFLCDADAMGFEGPVAAVDRGEELRQGQIYFVLPAEMARRRLTREEVAALAVKASAALVKAAAAASSSSSAGGRRRRGSVAPLVFAPPEEEEYSADTLTFATKPPAVTQKRRVAYRGGRSPPRFSPDLTAIPESEERHGQLEQRRASLCPVSLPVGPTP